MDEHRSFMPDDRQEFMLYDVPRQEATGYG